MINRFVGVGRLTADADLRYTSAGAPVSKFSICINDPYKKDGNWHERAYFFNCVVWGKYAEAMKEYLIKGRLIGIDGKLTHNPWKDDNGTRHNDYSIVVDNIHLFPAKPSGGNAGGPQGENHPSQSERGANEVPPPDDDIPF